AIAGSVQRGLLRENSKKQKVKNEPNHGARLWGSPFQAADPHSCGSTRLQAGSNMMQNRRYQPVAKTTPAQPWLSKSLKRQSRARQRAVVFDFLPRAPMRSPRRVSRHAIRL